MPKWSLKEFEYELCKHTPEERLEMIDSKLNLLQKIKATGHINHLGDYYIQELNKMRKLVHIYSDDSPLAYIHDNLRQINNKHIVVLKLYRNLHTLVYCLFIIFQ